MIYPFDQEIVWHVVFHPGKSLWSRKYRHVSLAGKAQGTWIHMDLHRSGVSMATIYKYDEVTDFCSYLMTYYTVVRVGKTGETARNFLKPMTCVSFVKHVLGIRSGALRPDTLLADLLRDYDGVLLNEALDTNGNRGAKATTADC